MAPMIYEIELGAGDFKEMNFIYITLKTFDSRFSFIVLARVFHERTEKPNKRSKILHIKFVTRRNYVVY